MPNKTDLKAICDPFLDRRCKLLPCQKEMILWWHGEQGVSVNELASRFRVSRRTIDFIVNPDKLEKNISDRVARGGSRVYYNRESHCNSVREHREYKKRILK